MTNKLILLFPILCLLLLAATCQPKADNDCQGKAVKDCMCASVYDPVCGCDETTYSNACEAQCKGIKKMTKGACNSAKSTTDQTPPDKLVTPDTSASASPTADSNECLLPNPIDPCNCTREYRPVCGCDRQTYPNPCQAKCKVKSFVKGTCESIKTGNSDAPPLPPTPPPPPKKPTPPPPKTPNSTTDSKKPCKKTPPQANCVCAQMYDPVCGCDGKTYSNACVADCHVNSYVKGACN